MGQHIHQGASRLTGPQPAADKTMEPWPWNTSAANSLITPATSRVHTRQTQALSLEEKERKSNADPTTTSPQYDPF